MKQIKNVVNLILAAIVFTSFMSCKKMENKVVFLGGTKPVLSIRSGQEPLLFSSHLKDEKAFTLTWTNPDYKLNTGVSSQDVSYTLQFDKAGEGFKSPDRQEKSLSGDLSYSPTVGEVNSIMAKLALNENEPHKMEVRLKASFQGGSIPLFSNEVHFTAIPYLDVAVPLPVTGELFIIGNATPGDWNNPVPVPSQQFTKIDATTYEITLPLHGGQHYLIIPENGSWANKYAVKYDDSPPADLWKGGDFGFNWDKDIPAPAESGNYKIELFFKTGKFKVTKL